MLLVGPHQKAAQDWMLPTNPSSGFLCIILLQEKAEGELISSENSSFYSQLGDFLALGFFFKALYQQVMKKHNNSATEDNGKKRYG